MILYTLTEASADLKTAGQPRTPEHLRIWAHRFPMQMPKHGTRERANLYDHAEILRTLRAVEAERATYVEWLLTTWDCMVRAHHLPRHAVLAA